MLLSSEKRRVLAHAEWCRMLECSGTSLEPSQTSLKHLSNPLEHVNRTLSIIFDNIQCNVLCIYDDKYEYEYHNKYQSQHKYQSQ